MDRWQLIISCCLPNDVKHFKAIFITLRDFMIIFDWSLAVTCHEWRMKNCIWVKNCFHFCRYGFIAWLLSAHIVRYHDNPVCISSIRRSLVKSTISLSCHSRYRKCEINWRVFCFENKFIGVFGRILGNYWIILF